MTFQELSDFILYNQLGTCLFFIIGALVIIRIAKIIEKRRFKQGMKKRWIIKKHKKKKI